MFLFLGIYLRMELLGHRVAASTFLHILYTLFGCEGRYRRACLQGTQWSGGPGRSRRQCQQPVKMESHKGFIKRSLGYECLCLGQAGRASLRRVPWAGPGRMT